METDRVLHELGARYWRFKRPKVQRDTLSTCAAEAGCSIVETERSMVNKVASRLIEVEVVQLGLGTAETDVRVTFSHIQWPQTTLSPSCIDLSELDYHGRLGYI